MSNVIHKTQKSTAHRWAKPGLTLCLTASLLLLPLPMTGTTRADQLSELTRPVSRVREKIRTIDSAVANLLLDMTTVHTEAMTAANLQETYRLVIRNLYRNSLRINHPRMAAIMALKADQLEAGLPAFDKLVSHLLPTSANAPGETPTLTVINGLRGFLKAARHVNTPLTNTSECYKYLQKMLGPLEPLISMESPAVNPNKVVVWPVNAPQQVSATGAMQSQSLPTIGQELSWIQGASLPPRMRQALRKILQELQVESADPQSQAAAVRYYPVIVRCAALAAHLQAGTVLTLSTQQRFNHRLLLGLLLFRDPRTRPAAIRRLLFINLIVNSLEQLRQANLPSAENHAIKHRIHRAITELQTDSQVAHYAQELKSLDALLRAYMALSAKFSDPPIAFFRMDQIRALRTGKDDFKHLATILDNEYSAHDITEGIYRLKMVVDNLNRLTAMPGAQLQAILYHPASIIGVKANMARWAKSIGSSADSMGSGSRDFDHFQNALDLLAQIHLSMAQLPKADIVRKMTGGRFDLAVKTFLKMQRKLTDSLGTQKVAPPELLAQLAQMRSLFATTRDLAMLLGANNPADKLNQWAGWRLNKKAMRLMLRQCEQTMVAKYLQVTAPAGTAAGNGGADQWAAFHDVAGAVLTLYEMTTRLNPQLHVNPTLWSGSYLLAITPPPYRAIMASRIGQLALARRALAAAYFNHRHGKLEAAPKLFVIGLQKLSAASSGQPSN